MNILCYPLKNAPHSEKIKALYVNAFPKEERLPWWIVKLLTLGKDTEVTAYYDGDIFCGFTFSASYGEVLFVLFLAVDEAYRGMGYGSAILAQLKQNNPGSTILLNVELLDPKADNYAQRLQRMAFYQKNGFYDTGYDIDEVGGTFRVLATEPAPDMDAYLQVFRHMSLGLWRPPIRKVQFGADKIRGEENHG